MLANRVRIFRFFFFCKAAVRPAAGAQYASHTGATPSTAAPPSTNAGGYSLPQPDSTGSLNIGGATSINAGSVSIADAIAKARGIAAEKGITYKPTPGESLSTYPYTVERI